MGKNSNKAKEAENGSERSPQNLTKVTDTGPSQGTKAITAGSQGGQS